ncbi:MAG: dihydrolipoyl dehydrogenase [Rhizobiaceae bacterium]|nr:dihydrolipoyl dehydrogenase [Rhizobiaceae bacterium]
MSKLYDVIIIGSGPGGYVAAIRAAQLGLKTAIIEREHLGGICLNWGCIPTKALLRSSEIYHQMQNAKAYGLKAEGVDFDIADVVKRSRRVSRRLNGGIGHLMKKNKVDVIWGEAKLLSAGEVSVSAPAAKPVEPQNPVPKEVLGEGSYKAKNIIIATGARPRALPGIEPDGEKIWTYFDAMVPKTMPKTMVVMGSGAIGIEFASFYNAMGTDVSVVELMDNIMPVEDEEISLNARKQLEKLGLKIHTGAKVGKVDKTKDGIVAHVEMGDGSSQKIAADVLISAVGVQGNIENLGLEALGVKTQRGCVVIDEFSRSSVAGVFAIGDVAGAPMLAHKAAHEGVLCVEKIAGLDVHPMDRNKIPGCTYCSPQVASVGLNEKAAKDAGYDIKVGRFPFMGNGKAIALGEEDGLIKTIFDAKTGQLLGAHMVGAEVTELIQGFVVAMGLETTEEDLMHTIFAHPTLSEMMHESVLDAYGRVMHM